MYRLYRSADCGRSFEEVSVLPFDTHEKVYGTMDFASDGALIVYIYDKLDEGHPPYTISRDGGKNPGARPGGRRWKSASATAAALLRWVVSDVRPLGPLYPAAEFCALYLARRRKLG